MENNLNLSFGLLSMHFLETFFADSSRWQIAINSKLVNESLL